VKAGEDPWKWGKEMLAIFEELRPELLRLSPPVIDCEVLPPFSGSPDGMFLHFICEHSRDVAQMKTNASAPVTSVKSAMVTHGFPASAVNTLKVFFTSLEDIQKGGGRFAFFR
jgi:hypothetical protein